MNMISNNYFLSNICSIFTDIAHYLTAARPNAKFRSPRCDMSAKISIKCQLKSIFCKIFQKFALNVSILTSNWPWSCWQRFKHYQSICFKIYWNIFHRLVFLGWNVERIMPHLSRFAVKNKNSWFLVEFE